MLRPTLDSCAPTSSAASPLSASIPARRWNAARRRPATTARWPAPCWPTSPCWCAGTALADLGTGPGLPGIPLALATPGLAVALVESNGKKARFLRECVRQLGLAPRVRVLESRAEAVAEPGAFEAITARALDRLVGILEVGGHLIAPGGRLLAMKGVHPAEEIAELPAGWVGGAVHRLSVPGLEGERHLVEVRRG